MAKQCKDKYDSWINPPQIPPKTPPNDGIIEIGVVTGEDFTGSHTVGGTTFTKVKGKCKEGPHRMKFDSVEGSVTFTYTGEITTLDGKKTVIGSRTQKRVTARGKDAKPAKPPEDPEIWVGVKTT